VEVLGVDIGGSGIKAAPVDVTKGALTRERIKVLTPQPAEGTAAPTAAAGAVDAAGAAAPDVGTPTTTSAARSAPMTTVAVTARPAVRGPRRAGISSPPWRTAGQ